MSNCVNHNGLQRKPKPKFQKIIVTLHGIEISVYNEEAASINEEASIYLEEGEGNEGKPLGSSPIEAEAPTLG